MGPRGAARSRRLIGSPVPNWLARLLLLLILVPAPHAGARAPSDAVEREWRIRRWALQPGASTDELSAALASGAWTERAAALEALARSGGARVPLRAEASSSPAFGLFPRLLAGAGDPHPNVRLAALRFLAGGGLPLPSATAEDVAACARDPMPAVRVAAAVCLADGIHPDGAALLAVLARDADREVADRALAGLMTYRARAGSPLAGANADRIRLAWFRSLEPRRDAQRILQSMDLLARARPDRSLLDGLGLHFTSLPEMADPLSAWVEALRLRFLGEGDSRVLARGWSSDAELDPLLREGLVDGAACADADLARILLDAACRGAASRTEAIPASLQAVDGQGAADLLLELGCTRGPAAAETWVLLRERSANWDAASTEPWLAPGIDADLRALVVRALADALSGAGEAGESGAGRLLVHALEDPSERVERIAFEALCGADDPRPFAEALRAAWLRQDPDERRRRLRVLPRGRALPPLRDPLLELGAEQREVRPAVAELLGSFAGDAGVVAALDRWLADELEDLRPEAAADGDRRPREHAAAALVRALHAAAGEEAAPRLEEAARELGAPGVEVGKVAVALLGRSAAGRERLPEFLVPGTPRRLATEAALALAAHEPAIEPPAPATAHLIESYAHCDWALRLRILERCGTLADAASRRFLLRVAVDPAGTPEQRGTAIASLERRLRAPADAADWLATCAAAPEVETRRAVLRAIGRLQHAPLRDWLLERLEAVRSGSADPFDDGVPQPPDVLEVLQETLMVSLADAGASDATWARHWLRRPLAAAEASLESRFSGVPSASVEFTWRAELHVASRLAAAGRLGGVLEASGRWWRLDGRLLLALGERARASEREASLLAARWLLRAARVALDGEGVGEDLPELRLECDRRLLALAEALGDRRAVAGHAQRLLRTWQVDRVSRFGWRRALGGFDPHRGVDALGRLQSLAEQAEAWRDLEAGRPERARRRAARANELCGHSRRAREEQRRLERALAE